MRHLFFFFSFCINWATRVRCFIQGKLQQVRGMGSKTKVSKNTPPEDTDPIWGEPLAKPADDSLLPKYEREHLSESDLPSFTESVDSKRTSEAISKGRSNLPKFYLDSLLDATLFPLETKNRSLIIQGPDTKDPLYPRTSTAAPNHKPHKRVVSSTSSQCQPDFFPEIDYAQFDPNDPKYVSVYPCSTIP